MSAEAVRRIPRTGPASHGVLRWVGRRTTPNIVSKVASWRPDREREARLEQHLPLVPIDLGLDIEPPETRPELVGLHDPRLPEAPFDPHRTEHRSGRDDFDLSRRRRSPRHPARRSRRHPTHPTSAACRHTPRADWPGRPAPRGRWLCRRAGRSCRPRRSRPGVHRSRAPRHRRTPRARTRPAPSASLPESALPILTTVQPSPGHPVRIGDQQPVRCGLRDQSRAVSRDRGRGLGAARQQSAQRPRRQPGVRDQHMPGRVSSPRHPRCGQRLVPDADRRLDDASELPDACPGRPR